MSGLRICVFSEGKGEIGGDSTQWLPSDGPLPALPRLVYRVLAPPCRADFRCDKFSRHTRPGNRGEQWRGDPAARKNARNLLIAASRASASGAAGLVVVIDRDGKRNNAARGEALLEGRNEATARAGLPCAVGQAIESFDAWMIADAEAIRKAGGRADSAPPTPEALGNPKEHAARAFGCPGNGYGLGAYYPEVARLLKIELLRERCPEGFGAFADDVRSQLSSILPHAGSEDPNPPSNA